MRPVVRLSVVAALVAALAPGAALARRRGPGPGPGPGEGELPVCTQRKLVGGTALPVKGDGYLIPETWASRGLNFGSPQLVALVRRVARKVHARDPDATLYVADLSPRRGGWSRWHRSHKTGRDVDLHFFALDAEGRPAPPPTRMIRFDAEGKAVAETDEQGRPVAAPAGASAVAGLRFDTARNWRLVRALAGDRRVERVFVSWPLKARLLAHARERREAAWLIARADELLRQPSDSAAHDDHFHVRIGCVPAPEPEARPAARRAPRRRGR